VVLADLADPGNVGTIVRSAHAAGAAGVVVTPATADPFSPKCVRASAGAVLHLPVVEAPLDDALDTLANGGRAVWIALAHGGYSLDEADLAGPLALVIGNEAHGVAGERASQAPGVHVPMAEGAESLNAAVAAAVVLFEVARRERAAGANLDGRDPGGAA
jgi:TrmH family RNA methyltransferase